MLMKTGLIFDMDGTLWDSSENVAASWTEKMHELGYDRPDITREDIMNVMGLTMDRIADKIFGDLPKDERMELLDTCCQYENEYLRKNGGVLYPDLEKTLLRLKEKYHLYIVSNCQKGYIEAFLDYFGFWKYFDDIDLAYAMTVHKTQGSEYDNVKIFIPKGDKFVTHRMLYTAITRGKCRIGLYFYEPKKTA